MNTARLSDLLLASVASLVGVMLFLSGVQPAPTPPEMLALSGSSPSRLWVGNSVAQRAIIVETLPANEARLALSGSEMGHWVAALERLEMQQAEVVIYASAEHLGGLELESTRDREMFWAIAPSDGGSARAWAVDQAPWMGPVLLERGRQRDRLLRGASGGLAALFWGPEGPSLLSQAQGQAPVRAELMPGRGDSGPVLPKALPEAALQDLIRAAGGSLTWVLPYERAPRPCVVEPLVQALSEVEGVRVIDLSSYPLPAEWFGSERHLMPSAQPWVGEELRRLVDTAPPGLSKLCGA